MILTLRPGEKFEVPTDAYTPIRFGTPFTSGQLGEAEAAESLAVTWTRGAESGTWPAVADGTGILLKIEAGMVTPGFYSLKPTAIIDGKPRKYRKAVGMRVLADSEVV